MISFEPFTLCIFCVLFTRLQGFLPSASWGIKKIHNSFLFSVVENEKSVDTTYDLQAWKLGFSTCESETCEVLEGAMPSDLEGTYFRNGHAKYEVGKDKIIHPFDADGMIAAMTISNGKAIFRNKFVRTKGYIREKKQRNGGILFRGAFGSQRKGGMFSNIFDVKVKNVANTNVMYGGGKLLALWEGGLPYRMEPDSLRTVGEYKLKGLLKSSSRLSAHPRYDAKTGRTVIFANEQGPSKCVTTIFELDSNLNAIKQRTIDFPGFVFYHDFIVTENYYIFNKAPLEFSPLDFLLGKVGPAQVREGYYT